MSSIHYCECGCRISCDHSHGRVREAVACIRTAGAYVVAVDAGTMRSLSVSAEAQFQFSVHNSPAHKDVADVISRAKPIDCRYAVMTRIWAGNHWTWTTWMCFETYRKAYAHARKPDRVVRFRSAEWQALRQQTAVSPSSDYCADDAFPLKAVSETLVEFVLRLLEIYRFEAKRDFGLKAQPALITSGKIRHDKTNQRKRA